jgi:hypothetical protein
VCDQRTSKNVASSACGGCGLAKKVRVGWPLARNVTSCKIDPINLETFLSLREVRRLHHLQKKPISPFPSPSFMSEPPVKRSRLDQHSDGWLPSEESNVNLPKEHPPEPSGLSYPSPSSESVSSSYASSNFSSNVSSSSNEKLESSHSWNSNPHPPPPPSLAPPPPSYEFIPPPPSYFDTSAPPPSWEPPSYNMQPPPLPPKYPPSAPSLPAAPLPMYEEVSDDEKSVIPTLAPLETSIASKTPTINRVYKKKKKKMDPNAPKLPKATVRRAADKTWYDPTLLEWPESDFRIFVGDLGNEVNDEHLRRAFSKYPSLAKVRVLRDAQTGRTRSYGFVSFLDPMDFANAMKEMDGKYIGNRPCKLSRSTWKSRELETVLEKEKSKKKKR